LSVIERVRKKTIHQQISLATASIRSVNQGEDTMPETGQNDTDQHAGEVEQLLERIRSLEEQPRKELAAKLMESVFHAPAKKVAVAGAMKSASEEAEPDLVTEAVRGTETLEGKKVAAAEAIKHAKNGEEAEVVAEAVRSTGTLQGKKSAAAEAVKSTSNLSEKQKILGSIRKETESVREMISHVIIWSFTVIAVVSVLTLALAFLGQLSSVRPVIIIGTAVASTLAGYALGAASMIGDRVRDLAREGTQEQTEEETQQQD